MQNINYIFELLRIRWSIKWVYKLCRLLYFLPQDFNFIIYIYQLIILKLQFNKLINYLIQFIIIQLDIKILG